MSRVLVGGEGEPLVNDFRLNKVYVHLMRLRKEVEDLKFMTVLQEPIEADEAHPDGQGPVALFYVISTHPLAGQNPYPADCPLISIASMPYGLWKTANDEYRHYAGLADPLRPIFAGLVRQHLKKTKDFKELYGIEN